MNKINYTKLQDESEIACAKKFLPFYNKQNGTSYETIDKNQIQNEVDVYCGDSHGNTIKLQVKKVNPKNAGDIGKSREYSVHDEPFIMTRGNEIADIMKIGILSVIEKYKKKDVSDIILLLDEFFSAPAFLYKELSRTNTGFKEVWLVPRNSDSVRLS